MILAYTCLNYFENSIIPFKIDEKYKYGYAICSPLAKILFFFPFFNQNLTGIAFMENYY